jgi:hypothetical protein
MKIDRIKEEKRGETTTKGRDFVFEKNPRTPFCVLSWCAKAMYVLPQHLRQLLKNNPFTPFAILKRNA